MDDDAITVLAVLAAKCYNEFKEAANIITSSSFFSSSVRYYDELITKLQLQAITEYGIAVQWQQQQRKPQEQMDNQKGHKKIFLVDDEPDTCLIYQIVLEDAGYQCISYTDSVKALEEFKPNYYDLVILDIKMPVLNGFELCKNIIKLDKTVQIIFITALPEYYKDIRDQSYPELINTAYVQKPIGNEELVQLVNNMIIDKTGDFASYPHSNHTSNSS